MNTFIFGLDGASPELIEKWIGEGHLPNLASLKKDGLHGKLESTFPPLTGPAWSSFQTGVNPGKHGVFNWLDLSSSYQGEAINRNSIKTRTVWDLISEKEGKVGLLSLPVTYPPEKVNGFLIPGFLTPGNAESFSYPKETMGALLDSVPDFKFTPPFFTPTMTPRNWVGQLKSTTESRGKAARFLYKKYRPETFMVHFFSTDHVQHKLWDHREDGWDPRLEVFRETDRQIGKIMEIAPENSTFMAISDHGFGPMNRIFNVNNWLHQNDFLRFKGGASSFIKRKLARAGITKERLKPIGEAIYPLAEKLNLIDNYTTDPLTDSRLNKLFLSHLDVDWNKTKAYSRANIGHVRINQKGRELNGTADKKEYGKLQRRIIQELEKVRLPDTGEKLSNWIKPKQEVYHGPYVGDAPDILFNPLPGNTAAYGAAMFTSARVFDLNPSFDPGHHRRDGILYASGPSVGSGRKNASILDIAPTIMNLNSYSIPEQMDGKVIREISPDDPSYYRPGDFYKRRKRAHETEDSRKKLENLGYL